METHTCTSEGNQALIDRVLYSELVRGAIEEILYYLTDGEGVELDIQTKQILTNFCRRICEGIIQQGIPYVDLTRVSYRDEAEPTEQPLEVDEKPHIASQLSAVTPNPPILLTDLSKLERLTRATTLALLKGQSEHAVSWLLGDDTWELKPKPSVTGPRWN